MILVTGGTGLVGSHLLYQLSLENNTILAIHRESSNLNSVKTVFGYYTNDVKPLFDNITWIEADIVDISTLQNVFKNTISQVYHCAAMVSFNPKDYQILRKINIEGTANIVNLCLENSVDKLCYVSSIATLDEVPGKKFVDEDNEWNPEIKHHGYAISKYGAEMEVWRASQEGLATVIVNPGVILGAGFWNTGSSKLFSTIANGFNYYTEGVTGFVGVIDVVNIMLRLMKSTIKNERFVLVAENSSFKTIFFQIADALHVKRPSIKVSRFMSELAWRLAWVKSVITGSESLLSKNSARSGHNKTYYGAKKIIKTLDFSFEPLPETIKQISKKFSDKSIN